jgi:hypothetical protein
MLRHAIRTAALATAVTAVVGLSGSAAQAAALTVVSAPTNAGTSGKTARPGGLVTNVPEPASLAVLAIGGVLVMCRRRR